MAELRSLIAAAQARRTQAPEADPQMQMGAMMLAMQKMMADIVTGALKDQAEEAVAAACEAMRPEIEAAVMGPVERMIELKARQVVESLPVPERVVERIVERVEMAEEEDDAEEEAPKALTVQRKDGAIASVTVGDVTYDVVRNKQGLIKKVMPRG